MKKLLFILWLIFPFNALAAPCPTAGTMNLTALSPVSGFQNRLVGYAANNRGCDGDTAIFFTDTQIKTAASLSNVDNTSDLNKPISTATQTALNAKLANTLTQNQIFVGNASNIATDVAMSGDVTIVANGTTTIANLAVTNAKIANSTINLTSKVTGILPNANTTATSANTASAIMARDGSGNVNVTSLTAATIYGGSADNSILDLRPTSSGTPTSGSIIRMYTNNALRFIMNNDGEATFSINVVAPYYVASGSSSGDITIRPQAAAGTYNLNLPTSAGSVDQVMTSQGGGSTAMTWTDREVPLTFSTGLTRSTNTITVNTSQNIAKLTNLTSNGFVKTSGSDGTLSIDTSTYLTTISGISAGGDLTGTYANPTIASLAVTNSKIANSTIDLTAKVTGILPNSNTTAASANTASTIVARDGSGNFSAATITSALTGNATTSTTLATTRAIYGNNFDGSAALTQIIASNFGGTGNGFTKFSGATTAEKTYTLPDASTTILTTNAAITVGQGGTGQTSYTNGQLLIGNTAGNSLAKATLTGTSNQVTVTNGSGSITLSTPQDIATSSSPTFANLTANTLTVNNNGSSLSGTTSLISMPNTLGDGNYLNVGTSGRNIGVFTGGNLFLTANLDYNTTSNVYKYNSTAEASLIELGQTGGALKYAVSGTAGNTATALDALYWTAATGDVTIATGNLVINTAGKTLKVKQGSNACMGTGATMVAGAVTVNTTAVATGDQILLTKTAAGGTSTTGMPVITIVNGTSFTITGGALDTSTWSWLIIKAA